MGVHLCEVALLILVEPRILSRIGTLPVPGFTRSLKPFHCGGGGFWSFKQVQTASDKQFVLPFCIFVVTWLVAVFKLKQTRHNRAPTRTARGGGQSPRIGPAVCSAVSTE